MTLFKFLLFFSILACFSHGYIYCPDPYDSNCAGTNIVVTDSTGILRCDAFAACMGANITVDTSNGVYVHCSGKYACANASIFIVGDSGSDYIVCYGSHSCIMAQIESQDTSGTTLECYGKNSCFGATIKIPKIYCKGVNSCTNTQMSIVSQTNCYGFGSCMNGDWQCVSNDACTIQMQGTIAANNTNIICDNGDCTFRCYLNGCYGLNVSGNAAINKQCYNTQYSTLVNDFCDESSTRDGIKYILDINNILSDNSQYSIPNLINEIDFFKEVNEASVLDWTYYEYDNFDGNNDINCSLYAEFYGISRSEFDYWTLTIHNNDNDYNGICCSGRESCLYSTFVVFANYSNNFNFIDCDATWSCYGGKFKFLKNGPTNSTMNIYGNGWWSAYTMTLDNTVSNNKINVFGDAGYSFYKATIDNVENIYCMAHGSCEQAKVRNSINVFGYGYYSMYQSTIENITNNVYCLSQAACYRSTMSNIGKNIYLFSSWAGYLASIGHVQGSVIAYGYKTLLSSKIECIDSYVFCIGYYSCYYTNITTVSQRIIAYGNDSLYHATINTNSTINECEKNNYFSKNNYGIITIEINGTMNSNSWITCSDGDLCAIYCHSSNACTNIYLYCSDNCIVICDDTGGIDCPVNGNGDTWTYSLYPTGTPSQSPTLPSAAPTRAPSIAPSLAPTRAPSVRPSSAPSAAPSARPSSAPTTGPSMTPTRAPSTAPSVPPSTAPSQVPSQAPTNTYCDATIQTNNTFDMCNFFMLLDDLPTFLNDNSNNELRSYDYCQTFPSYFECENDDGVITSLLFSNCEMNGEIISSTMKNIPKTVSVIDFSNNNFYGNVQWSWLQLFKNVTKLNFRNNNFSVQSVDFDKFEHVSQLSFLDLSNNKFGGAIKLSYFSNVKYLSLSNNEFTKISNFNSINELLPNLEQLYIENNLISEQMQLSWFSSQNNNNLTILHCYNNSLYGNINLNDLPNTTVEFICGNNDFGTLTWTSDDSESGYSLSHLDLADSNLAGALDMNVFDVNGAFGKLNYVYLNDNANLNISINFAYLSGSSIYIFNILNVAAHNKADFSYLTSFIVIKMDTSVKCVSSMCSNGDNGETISWTRDNDTCVGHLGCDETCECVTPYAAGLESYEDDGSTNTMLNILVYVILFVVGLIFLSCLQSRKYVKLPKLTQRDDFDHMACLGYLFQLWDFFSDGILAYDMFDHYAQESYDSPAKAQYLACFVLCSSFILIPWTVNLVFLMKAKKGWKVANQAAVSLNDIGKYNDSLHQSQLYVGKWLTRYSKELVLLCMLSGGLAPSLKVANCKLFGLDAFNMGLAKYKQEESIRHRIWLTVLLENVPQIIINLLYALLLLGEMDQTVLFALISSLSSVILALLSIKLEFPKHFYIYQVTCELSNNNDTKLNSKSKQTKKLAKSICEGMHQDASHLFVENVFIVDGGLSMIMNVVCHEKLKINSANNKSIVDYLKNKNKIEALNSVEMVFITHERVKLVHVKSILCCNKNEAASASESEMAVTVKNNSGQIKSETTSGMATPGINSPSDDGNAVDIFMQMSTEGDGSIDLPTKKNDGNGDGNGNGNNYQEWTCGQVCEWFESILLSMDDFKDNKNGINNFISLLKRQSVNGECILRMLDENDDLSKRMKQTLSSQCDSIGIWIQFEKEISKLKDNQ